jgi:hypothetical protein
MGTIINTQSGERLSFYKLFKEKKYRVLIPIIQRDYAQGRKTTKEVRENFLDALFKYLEEKSPNRDLDFVYGTLDKTGEFTDFIPLDGQQRLTTLFLLHWYLYQISENTEKKAEFKNVLFLPKDEKALKDGKSMFTYETRTSSSDFCNVLMGKDIDFSNLLENSLSKTIENSPWFFLSWKYDPTIISMLTMLDAIHCKFADKKEYFERLIDTENPIITFLFLNLKDFKLTDDLYIKMNSRGKQLTSFENFKAKFEQYLEKVPCTREFYLFGKKKSLKKYFSFMIDTDWANLFWNYKDLVEGKKPDDKNTYDDELNNFIRVIFTSQYATNVKITTDGNKEKTDDNFEFLLGTDPAKKREGYTNNISFYIYEGLNALSPEAVFYLIDAFNALVNGNDKLKNNISYDYKDYFDEEEIFEKVLKHAFTHNERIMFHAYIRFLIQNEGNTTGLDHWMRVIHNLCCNTVIDRSVLVARAIHSVEKMLPNSNNILNYLKNNDVDSFASWQTLEEKIKANLIIKNDNWKNKIENTEKIKFFDGQIGFILEFSGIVDYYKKNNHCDWTEQEDKDYFHSFERYANKAIEVFKDKDNKDSYNSRYAWERAVLTKGDYLIKATAGRKNLLVYERKPKEDLLSWKRLLRIKNDTKDEEDWASKRKLVREVFDDILDSNNLQASLEKICEKKTNDWRDCLIACPELIGYCRQGFIQFNDENNIILYRESRIQFTHSEMYSRFLWTKYIEPKQEKFKSFEKIKYCEETDSKKKGHIALDDLNISYCYNDKSPNSYSYKIVFNDDVFISEDIDILMKKLEDLNEEREKRIG